MWTLVCLQSYMFESIDCYVKFYTESDFLKHSLCRLVGQFYYIIYTHQNVRFFSKALKTSSRSLVTVNMIVLPEVYEHAAC